MVLLQASIGALNDIVDAPLDAGRKPGKPLPAGLVSPRVASVIATASAVGGLALTAVAGPAALAVAGAILIIGYSYDLRFKGTPWSWLPFATGIPLLPVFAWLGAAGSLPAPFLLLVPAGILAGAALAIANALADLERDLDAGSSSVAVVLGRATAWRVHAWLLVVVVATAFGGLLAFGASGLGVGTAVGAALLLAAGATIARSPSASARERGWEIEAIAVALLAAAWLTVVVR